ncbi:DUF4040 family protein [Corynebacterium sp. 3HC-13]|uniref:DUF4040 family protein n=1 Tax=Corynebacterium poyangense TaxID=2684405 RepID=UPI001CC9A313|nr:DUF4040 family protein [Corynebacterium poyangense]MBZ8177536.1 DUF4040 family protein [Corynebacterium poyangense]
MTLLIVIALAAAAVVLATPAVRLWDRHAGWPLAGLFVAGAVLVVRDFPHVPLSFEQVWVKDILGPGIDVSFALRGDALSLFFVLLALGIGAVVFIYSAAYLPPKQGNTSFYLIMTAFTLSILLLVLANDVIVLFIAWELVSIASFLLIARSGSGGEAGSQRTLVLTFFGGLTLLAALSIMAVQAGSTNLQTILNADFWAQKPGLTAFIAVLLAVSAFTKSAQFPFHFWLPEAMAAATPVSAFLHAAAVVKAGIYLLMRFSSVFHDVPAWNWLLIVVGMSTALLSAYFAIQKTDLKKLTAYSTVSHLGWIVATIGVGTPFALAAAALHTLAHALFKSSLFMLIGVIDHEAGSRDVRRLGPLFRRMPFTFVSVCIGAASMAAVPPLLGFISKEGMLTAFLQAPLGNTAVIMLLIAAAVGAILTFTYSARLVFGAFFDGPRDMSEVHEAPVSLWLPAALPGVLSLPVAFLVAYLDRPIEAIVGAIGMSEHLHFGLWHGINLPLFVSLVVLAVGIFGVLHRQGIWQALDDRELFPGSGNQALAQFQKSLSKLGRALGWMADSLNPSRHLLWLWLSLITLAGVAIIVPGLDGVPAAPKVSGLDQPIDLAAFAIIALSVVGLVRTRNRLSGVVFLGTAGVGVTLQMLVLGAPDVALVQFLVEALVVIIMMLVIRHQPATFQKVTASQKRGAIVVALLAGVATFAAVWGLLARHGRSELGMWFVHNTKDIAGGENVIAVILVEFRALDTLGELSVLGMAAVVIGAIIRSIPRGQFVRGTRPRPFGQSRLNAIPLQKAFTLVTPVLLVSSVLIFWRGHSDPGGGFTAALVAGAAIMLSYLTGGKDSGIFRRTTPVWLTGIGIITAVSAGFIGFLRGGFLFAIHGHFLGQHLTTSLIFDGGIYLAVLGMLTMAVNGLGGYTRPGADGVAALDYRRTYGPLPATPDLPQNPDADPDFPEAINPAHEVTEEQEAAR